MIYTLANTVEINRCVYSIIDANGLEWFDTQEVDTETGRIVKLVRDKDNRYVPDTRVSRPTTAREEVFTAAPIMVTFRKPGQAPNPRYPKPR